MHFAVLVITEEEPTREVLQKALVRFGPGRQEHWDWWEFGGRFSGNLIPVEFENVVLSRYKLPGAEISWLEIGRFNQRHERVSRGADALQQKNLAGAYKGFFPQAVVFQGQWHECEVLPLKALDLRSGLRVNILTEELEAERVAVTRWAAQFESLMAKVPADNWVSVIDCHS